MTVAIPRNAEVPEKKIYVLREASCQSPSEIR